MRRRNRALVIGTGAVAAAGGWLLAAPGAPPVYDGVVISAPYRLLCNAPPTQTHAAASGTETDPITGGTSPAIAFTITEDSSPQGAIPQFQFLAGAGALAVPADGASVTVAAKPVPPPAVMPPDGSLDGNVYQLDVTVGGRPVVLTPGTLATVVLRGLPGEGAARIEGFDGRAWTALDTQTATADVWAANVTAFGSFALVKPGPTGASAPCNTQLGTGTPLTSGSSSGQTGVAPAGSSGGGFPTGVAVVAAAILLALTGGALILRPRSDDKPRQRPRPRRR